MDNPLNLDGHCQIAVYNGGRCVSIDTLDARVFEIWGTMPDAIIPARYVRTLTKAFYGHTLYYRDWLKPQAHGLSRGVWLPPLYDMCRAKPASGYRFDGLGALSELFANETYDCIRFRSVTAFPQLAQYPGGHFGIADEACTFDEWEKGYLLALMRFGDTKAGNPSSSKVLAKYPGDIEFIDRYSETAKKTRRDMVGVLKAFAWMWDAFSLPLRYFSAQAALNFSREWLGYSGNDLTTFRRVFFKGGKPEKDGHGLRLDPAKPFIVRQWPDRTGSVKINSQAADHHGFDAQLLATTLEKDLLETGFPRRVLIC